MLWRSTCVAWRKSFIKKIVVSVVTTCVTVCYSYAMIEKSESQTPFCFLSVEPGVGKLRCAGWFFSHEKFCRIDLRILKLEMENRSRCVFWAFCTKAFFRCWCKCEKYFSISKYFWLYNWEAFVWDLIGNDCS